jgi:hypothetical protein
MDPDLEYLISDSTIVPAPIFRRRPKRGNEDEAIGRSRGGLSSKVNIGVDALGNPICFILTPGQAHICQAEGLISGLPFESLPTRVMILTNFAPLWQNAVPKP